MATSSIGAIGDAVVLIALWFGVIHGPVPARVRLPLAVAAFGSAWALCFVTMRAHFPHWTMAPDAIAIVVSLILVIVAAQSSLPHDGGGGSSEGGGGGPDRPPPDRPTNGGGPAEPCWWPEFERDLARYQAERRRAERDALVGS